MKIITIDSDNKDILYKKAVEVAIPLTESVKEKIEKMRIFYKSFKNKSGFAAPQVGFSEKIILVEQHLFDTNTPAEVAEPVILINPTWHPLDDKKELDIEGCLSAPGKVGVVERYINVELTGWIYSPETGQLSEINRKYYREFSSVLWQHEMDHLDGVVYVDKAKLVLNESDYALYREYLFDTGKIQDGMTLFDWGSLIYALAQEWQQVAI